MNYIFLDSDLNHDMIVENERQKLLFREESYPNIS